MIYTNEPANQFYVYLTAYRGIEPLEVNEKMLKGMIAEIRKYPGLYGVIEDESVVGCFHEAGQPVATRERTLKVRARNEVEADNLAFLACDHYDQDAILEVASQTHTATLVSYKREGVHGIINRSRETIGTLEAVTKPAGPHYSQDSNGQYWEVL